LTPETARPLANAAERRLKIVPLRKENAMDDNLPLLEFITDSEVGTPIQLGDLTGWETVVFELADEAEE
jgi:hypothetical protein